MDPNAKENLNVPEFQPQPENAEVLVPPVESEPISESLPVESETGQSSSAVQDDTQVQPQDYSEADLQTQAEQIAPLAEEDKLVKLKVIARDHSLEKAIGLVKKMNDPWLEDKFHDDLMDDPEWRAQLEAMGKIEKL